MTTKIVCTTQTDCSSRGHILSVGDGDRNQFTVAQVYNAMDRGETFYTAVGGNVAIVKKWQCSCGRPTLRSTPDNSVANNLDSLPACPWRAA